ncbi:MAG: hypothetical protein JHC26_08695 [Thermofilum sp.]|jgi:hypothetical protein|uniref:hypothetical protein n=1 Tax=Thermofilum sp. TaxID=1961369 RepID=UPI002589786F|nr:hypothetical protein [Thermofilum sp.]MCI4409155.1 hypothetical protein [Thermofilum sp.]
MDLERTARYIAQLSRHGYRYAIVGKLVRYDREKVKKLEYGDFVFYLCRLPSKKEVIAYCLPRSEGLFRVYCLSSKPLEFPNAPLKLHYDEKTQRLRLLAQKSFISDCLNAIEKASEVKYPSPKLYIAQVNKLLRQLYEVLAYTYNDKERVRAIRRKVKHWVVEALKSQYGLKPRDAMTDYRRYVLKFSDVLRKKKATKA